jgi:hypothetical protein
MGFMGLDWPTWPSMDDAKIVNILPHPQIQLIFLTLSGNRLTSSIYLLNFSEMFNLKRIISLIDSGFLS